MLRCILLPTARAMDAMPFDATVGRARVIEITHEKIITRAELEAHEPKLGERLLFKTSELRYSTGRSAATF